MRKWHIILAFVVIGAALYAPNLSNRLFWDDEDWIVNNPAVHDLSWDHLKFLWSNDVTAGIGVRSNYYRPVLMTTFAVNWAIHGDAPVGWHVTNNALHILAAVLLFMLLYQLCANRTAAGIVALLWLIHPVHPEAVAYVNSRGDSLGLVLSLGAIIAWLRVRSVLSWWSLVGLVLTALAILTKETAILIPGFLVLILMAYRYGIHSFWRSFWFAIKRAWPLIALTAGYLVLRLTLLNFSNTLNWYREPNLYTESIQIRLWTFFGAIWEYLRIAIWPIGLHMEHSISVLTTPWTWPAYLGIAITALAVWWVVWAWRKGDRTPFLGVSWFFLALVPASGVIAPINALFYEHWLYVPLIGLAMLAGTYGFRWGRRAWQARRLWGILVLVLAIAYAAFLSVQTVRRNIIWGKTEEFYLEILSYESDNVRVLNNLANLYADQGKYAETQFYLEQAIQADPTQPAPYHNLGNLMRALGEDDAALALYVRAIEVDQYFHWSYRNLAAILLEQGRYEEAVQVLTAYRRLVPNDPQINAVYEQLTSGN